MISSFLVSSLRSRSGDTFTTSATAASLLLAVQIRLFIVARTKRFTRSGLDFSNCSLV